MSKKRKLITGIIGVGLILLIGFFIGNKFQKKEEAYDINTDYLSILDEEESIYYLNRTPKSITFLIDTETSSDGLKYKLTDSDGNEIESEPEKTKENTYKISAPKNGFLEGEKYTLELNDNSKFSNKALNEAKTLIFAIEKDPIEHYEFTDQIIELEEKIIEKNNEIVEIPTTDLKTNDIIIGKNEDKETVAYKINNILDDNRAEISLPAIDEIYSELEIYGEYILHKNKIGTESESEIEARLIEKIENSSVYEKIIQTVYADEVKDKQILVELDNKLNNDKLKNTITITLKSDENGFFESEELKNSQIVFTLVNEYDLSVFLNINGLENWDISSHQYGEFQWSVDILYDDEKISKEDKSEDIRNLINLFSQTIPNNTTLRETIYEYDYELPGVPGFVIAFTPEIILDLNLQANMNLNSDYSVKNQTGLIFEKGNFTPYSNFAYEFEDFGTEVKGKITNESGYNTKVNTKLLQSSLLEEEVANFELAPEFGLSIDSASIATIKDKKDEINGYFDIELYTRSELYSFIKMLDEEYEYKNKFRERKFELEDLSFGKEIIPFDLQADQEKIEAIDFLASPPNFIFKSYNLKTNEIISEEINPTNIQFSLEDGTNVELKENQLIIPKTDEETLNLKVSYQDHTGNDYYGNILVEITDNQKSGKIDVDNFNGPRTFYFSSGVGAWGTSLTLSEDGSFSGVYSDTNAGESGDGYLATIYVSEFSGRFENIEKINDDTYSLTLAELNYKYDEGEEWIEDETLHVASFAYGIAEGKQFYLYTPDKKLADLNDEVLSWLPYSDEYPMDREKLQVWLLHHSEKDYGFRSGTD